MDQFPISTLMALSGFLLGGVAGATARRTRFCTFGAIEDFILGHDQCRLKSWAMAIAVSIIIVQILHISGVARIDEAFYLSPNFGWLGAIVGGNLFGFGMALVGTCSYGSLVRLGGGDLKALIVVLVIGLTAYMTSRGITGLFRENFIEQFNVDLTKLGGQGIPHLLAPMLGVDPIKLWLPVSLVVCTLILGWCFTDEKFRSSHSDIISGGIMGLLVALGFVATGWLGNDPFNPQPVGSLTYALPPGNTIVYLLTFSGATLNFGIGLVFGTISGSFIVAWNQNEMRYEAFDDDREMLRNLVGAFLMGFGGVTALGCTIGQGITGIATLSAGSALALISILLGATVGLFYLVAGSAKDATLLALDRIIQIKKVRK